MAGFAVVAKLAKTSNSAIPLSLGDEPPWRPRSLLKRFNGFFRLVNLLRHEREENSGNTSETKLAAKDSSVSPAGLDISSVVDDDKGDQRANTVGHTNAASEDSTESQRGDLWDVS